MSARPLPEAVSRALPAAPGEGDNLGLWLDRLLPRDPRDWSFTGPQRAEALRALARPWTSAPARDALARRLAGQRRVGQTGDGPALLRIEARTSGRLLVGGGSGRPTELSLGLDWITSAPRIPGSALKGLTRAVAEALGRAEGWDPRDPVGDFAHCFGYVASEDDERSRAGGVLFLDALPRDGTFALALDVLTPHAGPWYRGEVDAPVDWLSPVPSTFLTVVDTTFVFDLLFEPCALRAAERVAGLLQRGLQDLGVGGKTAAGYGYFEGFEVVIPSAST